VVATLRLLMDRITLHLPEVLNDGSAIPEDVFAAYEEDLLDIAEVAVLVAGVGEPGFQILRNVTGVWRSPTGRLCREPIRLYWLDLVDVEVVRERVAKLIDAIKVRLAQELVYATVTPIEVGMTPYEVTAMPFEFNATPSEFDGTGDHVAA
jgi:hypothetical protein